MQFAFPQPEFTVAEAKRRDGMPSAAFTYWTSGRGWVLRDGKRTLLVTPNEQRALPEGDLTIYDAFDRDVATSKDRRARVLLPAEGFSDLVKPAAPRLEGPGYFRLGLTAVNQGQLRALLNRCRERGLKARLRVLNPNGLAPQAVVCLGDAGSETDLVTRRRQAERDR